MALGHPDAQELAAHFDGEGARSTADHVADCPRCQSRIDELKRLRRHIRSAPLPDPLEDPPPQSPRVDATNVAGRRRRSTAEVYGPLIAIGVVLILVLLLIFLV